MEQVRPLYSHVQSTVLESLRREWQRYGWEDSEIDDKVDRLSQLWNAALARADTIPTPTATATQPSHSSAPSTAGSVEKKEEEERSAEAKRKRKGEEDGAEKRFRSGPRVSAPLTYPTLTYPTLQPQAAALNTQPSATTTAASTTTNPYETPMLPSATIPPYVSRSFNVASNASLPSPLPPPSIAAPPALPLPSSSSATASSSSAAASHRIPQIDGSPDAAPPSTTADPASSSSCTAPPSSSTASSSTSSSSSPAVSSEESSNPLLSAPLSWLDDPDSGDDVDLSSVRDLCLCQFERVSHAKNRWKVVLRDGIMNIKGKDYVFSKATGELQW